MGEIISNETKQKLDDLSKYAQSAPGFGQELKTKLDDAGLSGTAAGDAIKAGAEGAAAGIAAGAGVGAAVASAAVATGVLATGAVALQAIPVVGTIAGAVLGVIAGLVAFFTGKTKAEREAEEKHQAELQVQWHATLDRCGQALALLPEPMKSRAVKALTEELNSCWSAGTFTAQMSCITHTIESFPTHLTDLVIEWAKEQNTTFLSPGAIGMPVPVPRKSLTTEQKIAVGGGATAATLTAMYFLLKHLKVKLPF